jgi:hypothetical protein
MIWIFMCEANGYMVEPKQRAHSPLLAAGLASKLKTDYIFLTVEDSPSALRRGASNNVPPPKSQTANGKKLNL